MSINPYPMIPASAFPNLTTSTSATNANANSNANAAPNPIPNAQKLNHYNYPTYPHLQSAAMNMNVNSGAGQEAPRPPSPVQPAVTPAVASTCVKKLISSELKGAGFDGGQTGAMQRLEHEVVAFVQRLYLHAHEYAELSNRSGPVATDLLRTCDDYGLSTESLRLVKSKTNRRKRKSPDTAHSAELIVRETRSPTPELLPSDDEKTPNIPATI
ncbi:hypothetical protein V5O48_001217, partial [Marasmius crinis-equi]